MFGGRWAACMAAARAPRPVAVSIRLLADAAKDHSAGGAANFMDTGINRVGRFYKMVSVGTGPDTSS